MATNIPPHNLREVINAVVQIIDDQIEDKEETTIEEILKIIKGPDFPTGGMILGTRGIEEAYRTDAARSVCVRSQISRRCQMARAVSS